MFKAKKQARHGDLLLVRVKNIPAEAVAWMWPLPPGVEYVPEVET